MSKVRVIKKFNGGVSIIHPAPKSKRLDETEEQWLDRVFTKCTPQGASYEDIDSSALPSRKDRDSWVWNNNSKKVEIDSVKKDKIVAKKAEKELTKISVRNKLKGLNLTNKEIDALAIK